MSATTTRPEGEKKARPVDPAAGKWTGPNRPYDLVKEFVAALAIIAVLTAVLATLFSSPDEPSITMKSWSTSAPNDFVATATGELAGSTTSAGYGPPYESTGAPQSIGFLHLAEWAGTRIPVDPPNDFVINPLTAASRDAAVTTALAAWKAATADQQTKWASAYSDALGKAPDGDPAKVAPGDYGPVPALTTGLLNLATTGGLDSQLVSAPNEKTSGFYQTDYTRPILFLADSAHLDDLAGAQHLHGDQWGMMNETGKYPGQAWLWLYTFWYQVQPFTGAWADNADAIIWALMMVLSLVLLLLPFIPGLRSIPRRIPIYRLIWRNYYRSRS
jgi:hypothetical protein